MCYRASSVRVLVTLAIMLAPALPCRADDPTGQIGEQAAALSQAIDLLKAEVQRGGGIQLDQANDPAGALALFQQALAIDEEIRRQLDAAAVPDDAEIRAKLDRSEAADRQWIGTELLLLERYDEAIGSLESALPLLRRVGDQAGVWLTLHHLGLANFKLGRFDAARAHYSESVELATSLGDPPAVRAALEKLADVYAAQGRPADAEAHRHWASEIAESGESAGEVERRLGIGSYLARRGRHDAALEQFALAEAALRSSGPTTFEAMLQTETGRSLMALGRFEDAARSFGRALDLDRAASDEAGTATDLNNLGVVYKAQGRFDDALASYRAALEIRRRLGDRQGEANALANLGSLFLEIGDSGQGLQFSQEALALHRALGDRGGESADLNNIATIADSDGKFVEALAAYREVLAIERSRGDRRGEANALENIGMVIHRAGSDAEAERHLEQALAIYEEMRDAWGQAHGRLNLSVVQSAGGRHAVALDTLARALPFADESGSPETAWRVRSALRMNLVKLGQRRAAIYFGKQAVNLIQGMRRHSSGLESSTQRTLVDSRRWAYEDLADLLIEDGRLVEAQRVLGMLKEDEYFQYIQRDLSADPRQTQVAMQPDEARWDAEYASLSQDRTIEPAVRGDRAARWVAGLSASRQADAGKEVAGAPDGVIATDFTQSDLATLGPGAVVVHYLVTDGRVRILLTTPQSRVVRTSAVSRADLNRRIFQLRSLLQNPARDPRPASRALHEILVRPIDADLRRAGARVLMLYLDESLRYLPFAALHDGAHWLVEDYGLAVFTPVAAGKVRPSARGEWRVAGFGASRALTGFPALCSVPSELYGIVRSVPVLASNPDCRSIDAASMPQGSLPGVVALDERFTRDAVVSALGQGYPVLHIASHFVFRSGTAADSYLLLGDGGHLTLDEVRRDARLDFARVNLLTLSACETAVAEGMDVDGSEVEGLGALAQRRGASAVLATLWPVADASTGAFMREFYSLGRAGALTKAEALRRAQLSFIQGAPGAAGTTAATNRGAVRVDTAARASDPTPEWPARADAPFAHPFFWAPFILMGNWL